MYFNLLSKIKIKGGAGVKMKVFVEGLNKKLSDLRYKIQTVLSLKLIAKTPPSMSNIGKKNTTF